MEIVVFCGVQLDDGRMAGFIPSHQIKNRDPPSVISLLSRVLPMVKSVPWLSLNSELQPTASFWLESRRRQFRRDDPVDR